MRSAAAFILTLVASAIVSYCSLAPKIWAPFREDDQIQDQDQGRVLRPDDLRRMRSTASSYNPYDGPRAPFRACCRMVPTTSAYILERTGSVEQASYAFWDTPEVRTTTAAYCRRTKRRLRPRF